MAWIPQHFWASSQEVAEKALLSGDLTYPGICYIQGDGYNYTAWVTKEKTLEYIGGYNQITGVEYHDGKLDFMSGNEVMYEADTAITPETEQAIIDEITVNLNLDNYATKSDVAGDISAAIGDLGDSDNVVDYISQLSYDELNAVPIVNVYGSLSSTVNVSDLETGVYKVHGQFRIGGAYQTIQMSAEDSIFLVVHTLNMNYVTQLSGNELKIYTIDLDGNSTSDKYVTEQYIQDQNFIGAADVIEYVKELVNEGVEEAVADAINRELEEQLASHFSAISDDDIMALF